MATQMSPESSPHSSPKRRLSFSPSTTSKLAIVELESVESSKLEVKDVQVDDQFTVTGLSKRHKARLPGKSSENVSDWKRKVLEFGCSAWEVSETAKGISKYVFLVYPTHVFVFLIFYWPVEVINDHSAGRLWRLERVEAIYICYLVPCTRSIRKKTLNSLG